LGGITAKASDTRWLENLKQLNNFFNNHASIEGHLNNNLYAAAELKPLFRSIMERRELLESLIKVLELFKEPLVKLQVVYSHSAFVQFTPNLVR
jgi:F0F1-type ATP synthase delta subunit